MIIRDLFGNILKEGDLVTVNIPIGEGTVAKLPSGLATANDTLGQPTQEFVYVQIVLRVPVAPNGQADLRKTSVPQTAPSMA